MPDDVENASARSPVEAIETGSPHDSRGPQPGIALCLSGGGYRAMLFHTGALWRLAEVGLLARIDRISSVSGGSITAGVLGLHWQALALTRQGAMTRFTDQVVAPVRRLASHTIDEGAILGGLLLPGSIADKVTQAYRKQLFGSATLQAFPDVPRFVINATNVQSGALWRFSKPYMRDYRVGTVHNPDVEIAIAVAASSAFPPVLSPVVLEVAPTQYEPAAQTEDLHREPFLSRIVLSDGGVYDNLGLETAWKRYQTILVSDGGGKMQPEPEPKGDWARHALRVNEVIDNQVRSLRKRQVIASYRQRERTGTYWGIRTNIAHYRVDGALPCPVEKSIALANLKTRLKRLDDVVQERVINWGYAVADAALRCHVESGLTPPPQFPYPSAGIG